MEVILTQDIEGIGKAGSVVKVKDGFARNYLIPRSLAVPVTKQNMARIEQAKAKRVLEDEKNRKEVLKVKERLDALSLTIAALTQDKDKLYGGISSVEIAKALKDEDIEIDKSQIILDEPIKALGIYEVPVKLHPEITTKLKVWIVKK